MIKQKPCFITFEGGEAVGKSTLIHAVYERLKSEGYDVLLTREPGGSAYGEEIRTLIFHPDYTPSCYTELLLVFAARRDHIEHVIAPALAQNKIVLCDRYIDSSYVYQGILGGVDLGIIDILCEQFVKPYFPNATFMIMADTDISYARLMARGIQNRNDNIDKHAIDTLSKAYHIQSQKRDSIYKIMNNGNMSGCVLDIMNKIRSLI